MILYYNSIYNNGRYKLINIMFLVSKRAYPEFEAHVAEPWHKLGCGAVPSISTTPFSEHPSWGPTPGRRVRFSCSCSSCSVGGGMEFIKNLSVMGQEKPPTDWSSEFSSAFFQSPPFLLCIMVIRFVLGVLVSFVILHSSLSLPATRAACRASAWGAAFSYHADSLCEHCCLDPGFYMSYNTWHF